MAPTMFANAVGAGAALCSIVSFLPQIAKILKTRDVSGVSLRMFVVTAAGFSLWTAYGALLGSWPLVLSNLTSLSLSAIVVVLRWRIGAGDKRKNAGRTGDRHHVA